MTVQELINKLTPLHPNLEVIALTNVDGPDLNIEEVFLGLANKEPCGGDISDYDYIDKIDAAILMLKE